MPDSGSTENSSKVPKLPRVTKVPKVEESCHFYMVHHRDAEPAEVFYKEIFSLCALRLCGEL
jgi:hypothetical protein